MAYDKAVDSSVLNAGLTKIADAIRAKAGSSGKLAFPDGMAAAVAAIETGGGGDIAVYVGEDEPDDPPEGMIWVKATDYAEDGIISFDPGPPDMTQTKVWFPSYNFQGQFDLFPAAYVSDNYTAADVYLYSGSYGWAQIVSASGTLTQSALVQLDAAYVEGVNSI